MFGGLLDDPAGKGEKVSPDKHFFGETGRPDSQLPPKLPRKEDSDFSRNSSVSLARARASLNSSLERSSSRNFASLRGSVAS